MSDPFAYLPDYSSIAYICNYTCARPFLDRKGNLLKKTSHGPRLDFFLGFPGDNSIAIKKIVPIDQPCPNEIAVICNGKKAILDKSDFYKRLHFSPQEGQEFVDQGGDFLIRIHFRILQVTRKQLAFKQVVEGLERRTCSIVGHHRVTTYREPRGTEKFDGVTLMRKLEEAINFRENQIMHLGSYTRQVQVKKQNGSLNVSWAV